MGRHALASAGDVIRCFLVRDVRRGLDIGGQPANFILLRSVLRVFFFLHDCWVKALLVPAVVQGL